MFGIESVPVDLYLDEPGWAAFSWREEGARDPRSPRVSARARSGLRLQRKGSLFGPNTKNRVDNPPATRLSRRHQISTAASAPLTSFSLFPSLFSPPILTSSSIFNDFPFPIPLAEPQYIFKLVILFLSFPFFSHIPRSL